MCRKIPNRSQGEQLLAEKALKDRYLILVSLPQSFQKKKVRVSFLLLMEFSLTLNRWDQKQAQTATLLPLPELLLFTPGN